MKKKLVKHLGNRITELGNAKKKGVKIIGYFPGDYVPVEIIYASGAIPLCLADGGDSNPVDTSLSVIPRHFCSFVRAQVGEMVLRRNPYYSLIDMIVSPIACLHLQKLAEIIEYNGNIEIFKLGIPRLATSDADLKYYADRIEALKNKLEEFTGNKITSDKIRSAIELCNKMRELLKQISLMRRSSPAPISAIDFVKLNHASYYADPVFMVEVLESTLNELNKEQKAAVVNAPRLLLIGPNIANGDYKIMELIEEAGGDIVIEEVCEGIRSYWQPVESKGDPIESLAKAYLRQRVPCGYMTSSTKTRLDFALKLIKDFTVSGVIFYNLLGCETYDAESYFFTQKMEENKIPTLVLESDYGMADIGQIKTRIEAFMEMLEGAK